MALISSVRLAIAPDRLLLPLTAGATAAAAAATALPTLPLAADQLRRRTA
jgi:hypothetical protein